MNMRINLWKKLIAFLLLLCFIPVQAQPNYDETNDLREKLQNNVITINFARDQDNNYLKFDTNSTNNTTNNSTTEKDMSFSTGFVESLIMIFFAEFGDRVNTLHSRSF